MDVRRETRRESGTQPVGNRGGLWSLGDVLDELMPRYAAAAEVRSAPAVVGRLDFGWRPFEAELASV